MEPEQRRSRGALPMVEAARHPEPGRRDPRLYRIAHVGIVTYLVTAGMVAIVDPGWLSTRWLSLHMVFLGAVTTAIMVWSAHFTQALTRAARGDRGLGARLAVLNAGVLALLAGVAPVDRAGVADVLAAIGVGLVAGAVVAHAVILIRMARSSLGGPLRGAAWYYVAASGAFLFAAPLGAALATGVPRAVLENVAATTVHVHLNIFGWVGLTVLGTLLMLWPAALRVRMDPRTPRLVRPVLAGLISGLSVAVAGLWTESGAIAAIGLGLYLAAVVAMLVPFLAAARRSRALGGPALGLGLATGWFAVYLLLDVVAVARDGVAGALDVMTTLIPVLALGFLGQVLVASLTFLLPVVFGGGPAGNKRLSRLLGRWWTARVITTNAGLVLAATLDGSAWGTLGWLLAGSGLASFLPLAVVALLPPAARERVVVATRRAAGYRWLWTTAVIGAPLIAIGTAVALLPGGDSEPPPASASADDRHVVEVVLTDFHVEPARLEVPRGADVVLLVRNDGIHNHDLRVDGIGGTRIMRGGESDELYVGVVTEALSGWCTVGAHRQAGMEIEIVPAGEDGALDGGGESDDGDAHGQSTDHTGAHGQAAEPTGGDLDAALSPQADPGADWAAWDARLEPAPGGEVHEVTLRVTEEDLEVAPGVTERLWTFGGQVPGPVLRGTVGDVFEVTLVNDGSMAHSIDFHASEVAPDVAMRSIEPGESLEYRFRAERAGVWMYHCSTGPVLQHVANGMYGAVVVDPPDLEPVDHEFLLVQSDLYVGDGDGPADYGSVRKGEFDLVAFNGYANQYLHQPLSVSAGDRVRTWVLAAGPNGSSAFHVVGAQFDTVFKEGAYLLRPDSETSGGAQTLDLAASQGGFAEFTLHQPGRYPFLTHRLGDAELGATGVLVVD